MSRIKKKRLPTGILKRSPGNSSPMVPVRGGQRLSTEANTKVRPRHTYSTRPRDFQKGMSVKPHKAAGPPRGVFANSPPPAGNQAEEPMTVAANCAALPALVITTPCRTRSPSTSPKRYRRSFTPSPITHTPRTGHSPSRDFDHYTLRYLAQKAIRHSKRYAKERSLDRERKQCRGYSSSPPPLSTRHRHYCGQKPYRKQRTVLQMVSSALERGIDVFRTLIEDGPIGHSARYCRRRIKRFLRPIWCNCLRNTCLGPPADPIQRYVLTRGRKVRDRARNRQLMKKFSQLPTPIESSLDLSRLSLAEPEPETGMVTKEASTTHVPASSPSATSELQSPSPKAPISTVYSLLKSNESPSVVGHGQVLTKQQEADPKTEKSSSSPKPTFHRSDKIASSAKSPSNRIQYKLQRRPRK